MTLMFHIEWGHVNSKEPAINEEDDIAISRCRTQLNVIAWSMAKTSVEEFKCHNKIYSYFIII